MFMYYVFFSVLLLWGLFSLLTKHKYDLLEKLIFIIISILLILFAGLRSSGIGIDTLNYESIYNTIKLQPQTYYNSIEKGYFFLNLVSTSFQQVIFIMAFIGIGVKVYCINKYSDNRFITMLFYFTTTYLVYDMGIMRQGVAMGFSLISIKYILDRNFIKFIFVIFLGTLFHKSILIFIPLYFMFNININKKKLYIFILISIFLYILKLDETIVSVVMEMDIPIISSRLRDYYYTSMFREDISMSIIRRIIFLIIFFSVYYKEKIQDNKLTIFLKAYLLSLIIMCLFPTITIIGVRGSYYLYSLQMFIFATIIEKTKNITTKVMLVIIVICLSLFTMKSNISNERHQYVPYNNVLLSY